jgi:two-component system chemotaxis sensor kinase CheA
MKKQVDIETLEIITSFVAEGYERLDDAEAQLERVGSGDPDCLNSVFRLFHSVKGSAGYLCFDNIKLLTHEAEALLEVCIKEKAPVTPEALDLIYQTIDALRSMISLVEKDNCDDDASRLSAERTAAIKDFIPQLRALATGGSPSSPATQAQTPTPLPPQATQPPVASSPDEGSASAPEDNLIILSELVTADMVERFLGECADLVDEVERKALAFSTVADGFGAVNEVFRAIHTIKGNAGFFGHSLLERTCMETEGLLDRARKSEIPVNEALTNLLIARIDLIRNVMAGVNLVPPGGTPATSRPPASGLEAPGKAEMAAAAPAAAIDARGAGSSVDEYRPLGEILVDMGAVKEEDLRQALSAQERPIGEILVDSGSARPEDVAKALGIQQAKAMAGGEPGGERAAVDEIQRKEIRVDTAKLDKLFELVGELITAEAMVGNCPDLAGLKLDSFQKSFAGLNKISREIQETAMMIRMIPLDGLFHKMTRLVRDLSRKFGKPVNLLVSGQDTEMDKNVIDQISDPLVHILRNAIDHGLENPELRAAAGKPEAGTVKLHAKYEGSEIWITVSDDGAGLNREKIVAKALQKGLISGDPALLPDAEIWKLIFEPGFSTADKVSEVSGRGVGMDVVKKNLERIRGRVDIKTEKGQGTEFILKIPLTMAIIDGITVRCGGNFYSLPLGDILEFFKVNEGQLTVAERGEEAVRLRGSVLPLIKLAEVFRIEGAANDPCEGIVIVVQSAGKIACVLIDEVVGNQQIVVKSLSEYLGKVDGISGCSILGNGTVSFIIDTGKLIALRLE